MIEIKIGDSLFLLRRNNCDLPTARLLAADLIPVEWNAETGRYEELRGVEVELSLIHISEPTRLGMISYAVFCLKK